MSSQLDQLRKLSIISADTSDIELIKKYKPQDATSNPVLVLDAVSNDNYKDLVQEAVFWGVKKDLPEAETIACILDKILVNFGAEILKNIPGRLSTEVDVRLTFNIEATVARSLFLVDLYEKAGISRDRILIKIAGTWEGLQAASILESKGIHCNITLVFSLIQAIAAAEAGVTLVSPFVGRVLEWYQAHYEMNDYTVDSDPGVLSVAQIYSYYKKFDIKTQVLAASFRSKEQILALAGCDILTISPKYLEELEKDNTEVKKVLTQEECKKLEMDRIVFNESIFRFLMNDNAMACEQLADGIRRFSIATKTLESSIIEYIKVLSKSF